ncbi:MAG: type IV secretion system protein [Candidatus Thermoplasmatota archaeon]|nr:type IV secretion system protein [Candidatus Thermoplasmatota archaeon]
MALGDISGLLSPLIERAAAMSDAFVPLGKTFLALSVVMSLMYAVYDWWLGGVSDALARLTRAGLVLIIPLTLLFGWNGYMKTFTDFFSKELTAPILAVDGSGSGPEAVKGAITKLSQAMFPNTRKVDGRSTWEKVRDFITSEESIGGAILSSLTEAFFEMLLFGVALIVSMALVFALYGPLLALQVGVIFGPLLVAWMPFQPLSHLARNWLTFMLSQGVAVVVGVTIAVLAAGVIGDYSDQMLAMARDPSLPWYAEIAAQFGGFMASTAVIVFVGFMLFRADDIAAAMIGGGGAGMGGVGGAIMSRIAAIKPKPTGTTPQVKPPSGG